jgi:hypothetical protein
LHSVRSRRLANDMSRMRCNGHDRNVVVPERAASLPQF